MSWLRKLNELGALFIAACMIWLAATMVCAIKCVIDASQKR
jgi:hypothetical protein